MNGIIRKLSLVYPFLQDERQKTLVFSIEDRVAKYNGLMMHSIIEEFDETRKMLVYKIYVGPEDKPQLWKEQIPHGCTVELEYLLK